MAIKRVRHRALRGVIAAVASGERAGELPDRGLAPATTVI
jgi:hypothetical protein